MLSIAVEFAPERRNYTEMRFAVFDAVERKALRAALLPAKKKREAVPYGAGKASLCVTLSRRTARRRVGR